MVSAEHAWTGWQRLLEPCGHHRYRLPPRAGANVIPVEFLGTRSLLEALDEGVYQQAVNTGSLHWLRRLTYTQDVHVGYGTCIGTVALAEEPGWISAPMIGFDIG